MGGPAQTGEAGRAAAVDWDRWHASYDRAGTPLQRRLSLVRAHVAAALDRAPPGPVRVISICAGQGHDLLGVLPGHPRRADVTARLVELDPGNVAAARSQLCEQQLRGVEVVEGDASLTDAYRGAVPAQLVLVCGVFGNISAADVQHTISHLPALCASGASVVWTRHRNPPDLVPAILAGLQEAGFETPAPDQAGPFAIATSTLRAPPPPFAPGVKLFDFVGHAALWPHLPARSREALEALFRPDCSLVELVEAMRALPPGGGADQSDESMLREGRGTSRAKHRFLAGELTRRFPATAPQAVHRVHLLTPALAHELYGPAVAASVPPGGIADVHRYLTIVLEGRRVPLDVTVPGEPWSGRTTLAPACGEGEDHPVHGDAEEALEALERTVCEPLERGPFLQAMARLGLPAE